MTPTPGTAAPTVTQWVAGTPSTDAYGNEVPTFTKRTVRVLAEFPGESAEADRPGGDRVTADLVLLVTSATSVSALDEWTASDGLRYRVDGQPFRYRHPFTGTAVTQVNLRRIS